MNSENQHLTTTTAVKTPEIPAKGEEGGLLVINGTFFVIIVSFIIFAVVMQKIFYGPVLEIKRKRSEYTKKMKAEAVEASLESEKLNKNYQESLKEARKTASEKTAAIINEANEEKIKLLNEKKSEVSEYLNEQKQNIQNEKNCAEDALKGQIMDYAYKISEKILGEGCSMENLNPEIVNKALSLE